MNKQQVLARLQETRRVLDTLTDDVEHGPDTGGGDYPMFGLRGLYHLAESEALYLRAHQRSVVMARHLSQQRQLKLHVGAGSKAKPGWINIDPTAENGDLPLDLREPLPFADDSCAIIYSEHFLEHIDYPEVAQAFLAESYRVLESGGCFSVGVPDSEWPLREYAHGIVDGYYDCAKKYWHPVWCQTEIEHINFHARQSGEHRFAYDFVTLAKALRHAGFEKVERRDFDPELDSADRNLGRLYARAWKP